MYLKALEIQGFKSFPEKTRLTFEKNITAIVGPNGSGKSNISDALRWVMGEQNTRALRGGKMEDVIFGGTELRNQLGFAEVSLVLDNSNRSFQLAQNEVMITRRYYRSGESEYAINKETVRLKDVHEILMDTGMGRDGYAIIDQGRIGEILSQRSIDRREILEEAAGISRFRYRKEESERKLKRTEDDLMRINDKVEELRLQVDPLREQAEIAKQYLILRDNLRGVEISLWLAQLDKCRDDSLRLSADFEQARVQFLEGQKALEALYQDSENFMEQFREKDVQAEVTREKIETVNRVIGELNATIAVLQTKISGDKEAQTRLLGELTEEEDRAQTLKAQIDERYARIKAIEEETAGIDKALAGHMEALSKLASTQGSGATDLEQIMGEEAGRRILLAGETERLSAMEASIIDLEKKAEDLALALVEEKKQEDSIRAELQACKQSLEAAQGEQQTLQNMIRGHELKMSGRETKRQTFIDEVNKLTLEHGAICNRKQMLTEMEREFQGFTRSVKEVMQETSRGRLRGVHGPVANLLSTEDKFALAIETSLGAAGQNIIVDTPQDGKYAIEFLKRQNAGRATFLPLSSIRGNVLVEKGLAEKSGFIGIAYDLVDFDRKFETIYKNILGRTVIVETLDQAITIAKAYDNRFRLVTLDGQELRAGGAMTGGSTTKTAGFLSRANEIKTLEVREGEIATRLEKRRAELEDLEKEWKSAAAVLHTSKDELRQVEDHVLTLEGKRNTQAVVFSTHEKQCADLETEQNETLSKIRFQKEEIQNLNQSTFAHKQAIETLQEQVETLTQGQKELNEAREGLNQDLSALQTRKASLAAEGEADKQTIGELESLAKSMGGDRKSKEAEIVRLQAEGESLGLQITEKEEEIQKAQAEIETCRQTLKTINEEKLAMEARRSSADRLMQEKNKEILNMERECSRLEQQKLTADLEEKQILDKLWDSYELNHTTASQLRQEIESVASASREVAKIKQEINSLGTPNIGAIEQFEIIGERYAFLTEQKEDIESAKTDLETIISDITGEMKEIFARAFQQIDLTFQETFTELFGGGKASLELEDPEDILGSGVEIKVQPPGKSLKTLTLLSGGEKAFVAVALYFAIQKIRPTPFCVMDEIEAALDEANVMRFAKYMRRLADKTQFIAITHRRGTMEEADMLYGVTMQERGVSRVIHVDLEESEQLVS